MENELKDTDYLRKVYEALREANAKLIKFGIRLKWELTLTEVDPFVLRKVLTEQGSNIEVIRNPELG
jgi:hypothetical protein